MEFPSQHQSVFHLQPRPPHCKPTLLHDFFRRLLLLGSPPLQIVSCPPMSRGTPLKPLAQVKIEHHATAPVSKRHKQGLTVIIVCKKKKQIHIRSSVQITILHSKITVTSQSANFNQNEIETLTKWPTGKHTSHCVHWIRRS